jgi:hypothetical protein
MLAEIAEMLGPDEVTSRLRHEYLAAVTGSGNPCCAMDVDADVAVLCQQRLAGVQPHPHAQWSVVKRFTNIQSSGEGILRPTEGNEECVALSVHLDTAVACERIAKSASVLGQHVCVVVAELLQQPR